MGPGHILNMVYNLGPEHGLQHSSRACPAIWTLYTSHNIMGLEQLPQHRPPNKSHDTGSKHVPQHWLGLPPTPWVPSTSLNIRPSHVSQHGPWTRPTTSVPNIFHAKGPEYVPFQVTGKHFKSGTRHTVVNMHLDMVEIPSMLHNRSPEHVPRHGS